MWQFSFLFSLPSSSGNAKKVPHTLFKSTFLLFGGRGHERELASGISFFALRCCIFRPFFSSLLFLPTQAHTYILWLCGHPQFTAALNNSLKGPPTQRTHPTLLAVWASAYAEWLRGGGKEEEKGRRWLEEEEEKGAFEVQMAAADYSLSPPHLFLSLSLSPSLAVGLTGMGIAKWAKKKASYILLHKGSLYYCFDWKNYFENCRMFNLRGTSCVVGGKWALCVLTGQLLSEGAKGGGGGGVETNCFGCSPNRMVSAVVASSSVSFQTNDRTEEEGGGLLLLFCCCTFQRRTQQERKVGPVSSAFFGSVCQ